MSTRGYIAYTSNGKTTYHYNHSDSYPSWLGVQILKALNTGRVTASALDALRKVSDYDDATPEDLDAYGPPSRVSRGTDNYALFRDQQGDLLAMLTTGVMTTIPEPTDDGEYGYHLNYDDNTLTLSTNNYPHGWTVRETYPLDSLPAEFLTD